MIFGVKHRLRHLIHVLSTPFSNALFVSIVVILSSRCLCSSPSGSVHVLSIIEEEAAISSTRGLRIFNIFRSFGLSSRVLARSRYSASTASSSIPCAAPYGNKINSITLSGEQSTFQEKETHLSLMRRHSMRSIPKQNQFSLATHPRR